MWSWISTGCPWTSSYHMIRWCCLFGEDGVVGGVGDLCRHQSPCTQWFIHTRTTQLCIELVQSNCAFEALPQRCSEEGVVGVGGDSHVFVCCVHGTPENKTHVFKSRSNQSFCNCRFKTQFFTTNVLLPSLCVPFSTTWTV